MLRLAGPREVMILARENDELRIYAVMPERADPLFTLLDRNAIVVVRMQHQRRRLDVFGVLERRSVPVLVEIVEQESIEVVLVTVGAVARPVIADEVGHAAQRNRRLETIRVSENPVGHEAAVAAAGDAQAIAIDPRILLQRGVDAGHHVLIIHSTAAVP